MTDLSKLEHKIGQWLSKVGYSFELSVGRRIAERDWIVSHARYYRDPLQGKTRELDLFASKSRDTSNEVIYGAALTIECKRSSKPWVVFSTPKRPVDGVFPGLQGVGRAAQAALFEFQDVVGFGTRLKLLGGLDAYGHGIVEVTFGVRPKGRNPAYGAVRSAVSAAAAMAAARDVIAGGLLLGPRFVQLMYPVVVLDGLLFEASLDQSGGERLRKIDVAQVLVPPPNLVTIGAGAETCVVNVVTTAGLSTIIDWAEDDLAMIDTHLAGRQTEMRKALEEIAQRNPRGVPGNTSVSATGPAESATK